MKKRIFYKYLFIIGALWNFVLALPYLISSFMGTTIFTGASLMYYQGFLCIVIIFGIGYFMVGLNIDKNHGIVIMGVIGKILVFIFFLVYYLMGHLPFRYVLVGVGDLIFAILFIKFLIYYQAVNKNL